MRPRVFYVGDFSIGRGTGGDTKLDHTGHLAVRRTLHRRVPILDVD